MSQRIVTRRFDGSFCVKGGQAGGYTLYLDGPNSNAQDAFATPDLRPLCPHIRAAKTVEEAQAIVDGAVTIGPYTVDYRNGGLRIDGFSYFAAGLYVPWTDSASYPDPLVNRLIHARTAAEVLTILKEPLVSQKKFTAVPPEFGSRSLRVLGGHNTDPTLHLYIGDQNTESAKRCAVPELAEVIDALNAAPTVAVAQAIIDAHLAEQPKEQTVSVEIKETVDFKVGLNSKGQVIVDCKYWTWVNNGEPDSYDAPSPVDTVADRLTKAHPTTIPAAVAIIKEFYRARS